MDFVTLMVTGTIGLLASFFVGAIVGVTTAVRAVGPTPEAFEKKLNSVLNAAKSAEKTLASVEASTRFARATSLAAHMYVEALERNVSGVSDALENLRFHVQREREFEGGL